MKTGKGPREQDALERNKELHKSGGRVDSSAGRTEGGGQWPLLGCGGLLSLLVPKDPVLLHRSFR